MKTTLRCSGSLLLAGFIYLAASDFAVAGTRRRTLPPPKPVYTAIAAVDRAGMTLTTVPKNSTGTASKTYHFTPGTRITLNGVPGTVDDLKPGQRIRVGLGTDADVAEELAITSPPAGAGGKPKRGK